MCPTDRLRRHAAFAASAMVMRLGADTVAHGYQPVSERIVQLFG